MKKFFVVSLILLLVLAFGTVYAQEKKEKEPVLEFKASGFIDAQSTWDRNITAGNPAAGMYGAVPAEYLPGGGGYDKTAAFMATRARLKFNAIMGKQLSGTIFFEMDSSRWGETGDGRNKLGYWSGDRAAVEIKNVYIDFGVPAVPIPISMRVGLQPLALRPNIFVYTDGMGIKGSIKVDPANIELLWFKALENKDYNSDDADVYGLHANAKVGPVTAGGYGLYYNMNSYPLKDYPVTTYAWGAGDLYVKTITPLPAKADFYWLGLYADGKLGPVVVNLDFVYDHGKVVDKVAPLARDVKYRGWATRAKIDYPWEKFNFGVVGMYASGADTQKTDVTGLPGSATKVSSYVMPPASEAFAIFTEGIVFYGTPFNQTSTGISVAGNYTQVSRGTIGGTWMGKLYSSFKATPWYKVTLQGLYIGDTTKNGNTVGTARKADGTLRDDKSIGWEFDLINEFQIYKNLKYSIGAGFLVPGKALRYYESAANPDDKPKTPWAVIGNLTYNF